MGESFTYQTLVRIFTLDAGGGHLLPVFGVFFFCKVPWDLLVEGAPRKSTVNMVDLVWNFLKVTIFKISDFLDTLFIS